MITSRDFIRIKIYKPPIQNIGGSRCYFLKRREITIPAAPIAKRDITSGSGTLLKVVPVANAGAVAKVKTNIANNVTTPPLKASKNT